MPAKTSRTRLRLELTPQPAAYDWYVVLGSVSIADDSIALCGEYRDTATLNEGGWSVSFSAPETPPPPR